MCVLREKVAQTNDKIMWNRKTLWIALLSLSLASCGSEGEKNTKDNGNKVESSSQDAQHVAPRTYGTAEVTDTVRLGEQLYTYEMECRADESLPVLKDEFGDKYYQNKVDLSLWKEGVRLGTISFVKDDFVKHASSDVKVQMEGALLTGFIYDSAESDAARLCFRTTIGWGGEGPKFKVYVGKNGKDYSIKYDDGSDANAYEAPKI